jgi:hypothetical protein
MLIISFDIEGILLKEFVPTGQTVNGKLYYDVLRQLRENGANVQTSGGTTLGPAS